MTPALTRLNFTAHVTSSVAWIGAVGSFLVLSIAGIRSRDAETVRGAYVAMNLIGQFLIVPLSLAALVTGIVQSLGTRWGLFRFYWVVVKFALTIGATILLLLHQFTAVAAAAKRVSRGAAGAFPDVGQVGVQLLADSGVAVVVLLVITTLAVYKPWGRTPFGLRQQRREDMRRSAYSSARSSSLDSPQETAAGMSLGLQIFLSLVAAIVTAFVLLHLAGGGLGNHGHQVPR